MATTLLSGLATLAGRITTPLLPDDYLDVINPLLSGAQLRGRIVEIRPETPEATTLVIKPGRGWRSHTPGQYLRVGVDIDGVRHWRTYSLTSRTADECLSITVKAVPGGIVSNHLAHRTAAGTIVHLEQAAGEFVLGDPAPAKILFLTAGSGITPVMGMLRNMRGAADVVVMHSAPTAADMIFGTELQMMADRGDIRLMAVHTRDSGRLDVAQIADIVDDLGGRHTWACGPSEMLDSIEKHWAASGMTERLHTERFRSEAVVTGEGGRVSFSATGTVVEADGTQSLLDAGESAGVLMPSGCRMGVCFGCVAPLRRGAVRDLRNGALTTAGDGVVVQTCISAAAGDCDIDL
jgi:ferredoxin-NADP reductase